MGSYEHRFSGCRSRNASRSIKFGGILALIAQPDRICADGFRRSTAWIAGFACVCLQASIQSIREPAKRFPVCQEIPHQELKCSTPVRERFDRQNIPPKTTRERCVSLLC